MKRLFVFGIVFGIIPSVALGADISNTPPQFISILISLFADIFNGLKNIIFGYVGRVYLGGTLTAMLTIVIFIYTFKKIKEATFEFPKDVIEVIIFLVMLAFVNYCLNNYTNYKKIVDNLDIPANTIEKIFEKNSGAKAILNPTNQTIAHKVEILVDLVMKNFDVMVGSTNQAILITAFDLIIRFIFWGIYAWFSFILIISIAMIYILNSIQAEFWKLFGVFLIPLIYFKATRGMVIFWGKTIITLTLIASFAIIIATLAEKTESLLIHAFQQEWEAKTKGVPISFSLVAGLIGMKIIWITFLKEIPAMINGMLGTSAGGSTGAFANSVAMGSIGAAGAGAGFAAFKGAMKGGKLAGNTAKGLGAAANQLLENGSGSAGASGSKSSLGGNIKKGFSTVKNITQGKSAYSKNETPKTPPTPPKKN